MVVLSMCSSLIAWGLFASQSGPFFARGRAPSAGRARPRKKGPRVCVVYDDTRAEAALPSVMAELLAALVATERAEVTGLRVDTDARGHSRGSLPEALTATKGVRWLSLPPTEHVYDGSSAAATSFRALEWLRSHKRPYDHVIFHAAGGVGHYPLLAREVGLALTASRVSVLSFAPQQLIWRRRPGAGASLEELEEDHMQRRMVERADALIAPASALRFMRSHDWKLPNLTTSWDGRGGRDREDAEQRNAGEARDHGLFGSLGDEHDGDEEDRDDDSGDSGDSGDGGRDSHTRRPTIRRVPRLLELWHNMASLKNGAGSSRLEAGTEAQALSELDRRLRLIEADDKLNRSAFVGLAGGSVGPLSAPPPQRRRSRRRPGTVAGASSELAPASPLVSVCVVHHERGPLLLQALESIRQQDMPSALVQVVLVDDGSTSSAALSTLEKLSAWHEFVSGRWLLLRRPSRYLGAARNEAARHAAGRYLYFLDDDNCLKRHSLSTLLYAAAHRARMC